MLETMAKTFSGLEDPRSLRNQKHPFLSLMSITLLSSIAGFDSFSGMAMFAECHEDELKKLLYLPHGIPSHDTLQRLFEALDPQAVMECFMLFTNQLVEAVAGLTAIDGKVIRNSGKENPLFIVSAWCEENRLVLGHVKADGVGHELEAFKKLLALLDLNYMIITLDALSCKREVAQQIGDGNGDYAIALKANQRNLLEDLIPYFNDLNWREYDKGHGRIEIRECWALPMCR